MDRRGFQKLLCSGFGVLFLVHAPGCSRQTRSAIGTNAAVTQGVPASTPSNGPVDLTVAPPTEPQTDAELFDESVVFAPNFSLNQNDATLSDLFSTTGGSELCVPTSLAEASIYLFAYQRPGFDRLGLDGLASDHKAIEPNALIRQLTQSCQTDRNDGTNTSNALACAINLISSANYGTKGTQLISPFKSSTTLPIETRPVTIQDMRTALQTGLPMLLEVKWFKFDEVHKTWQESGGHVVTAFGYDYDTTWGEDEIQLKIVNPELTYSASRETARFDTITIQRHPAEAGITYPQDRPFIVSGSGFSGQTKRGFVGEILTFGLQQRP